MCCSSASPTEPTHGPAQAEEDQAVEDLCRERNISKATFHRWKRKYGDMDLADAKRLKELEKENGELKKMLAESMVKIRVLEEANSKKVVSPAQKKQAVEHVIVQGLCSVRRACHYLGLHRSTYRYRPSHPLPQQIQ